MKKYNLMIKVVAICNILFFIVMPPLGMRFAHGLITTVSLIGCTMIEDIHIARIYFIVLLLSLLFCVFQGVCIFSKKIQSSQKNNSIARAILIVDTFICAIVLGYIAIRYYYLHEFEADSEWDKINPFLLAGILWAVAMIVVIVFCKLKNEKAKFGLIIACYSLFVVSVIVIPGIVLNLFFEISASMTEYCAVFCFVEDVILILLLTMRKKEMARISIEQTAIQCPDENSPSDGTD